MVEFSFKFEKQLNLVSFGIAFRLAPELRNNSVIDVIRIGIPELLINNYVIIDSR